MNVNLLLSGIQSNYATTDRKIQNKTTENTEFSDTEKLEASKKNSRYL